MKKINKKEISEEKIFEIAIESGANECISNNEFHEIHCDKSEIYNVKKNLEKTIEDFVSTDISWIPINSIEVSGDNLKIALEFLEELEENDDVQNVYTNLSAGFN